LIFIGREKFSEGAGMLMCFLDRLGRQNGHKKSPLFKGFKFFYKKWLAFFSFIATVAVIITRPYDSSVYLFGNRRGTHCASFGVARIVRLFR
jgi:hypothetical protein